MRVLVTGATGFVGRHLARRLVADGHEVHVIVRPTSDLAALGEVHSRVTLHEFGGGAGRMGQILETASPDLVFHLASRFRAEHAPDDVESLVTANILLGEAACGAPLRINWGLRPYRDREVFVPYSQGTRLPAWSPRNPPCRGSSRRL
jgi:nucleoside-diphosphate-sugar epimerase